MLAAVDNSLSAAQTAVTGFLSDNIVIILSVLLLFIGAAVAVWLIHRAKRGVTGGG